MNTSLRISLTRALRGTAIKRGALFGAILITALVAFEVFNYSTTAFALQDVLGALQTAGLPWSTILALAFCGIDFAGIARLFTPQQGRDEPAEVWYLFGAWLLAAGFNALLTWWGVSVAILNHTSEGSILIGQSTMTRVVPVLVAVMVWMIRVLIIGTFSLAGENMFSMADARAGTRPSYRSLPSTNRPQPARSFPRSAPKPLPAMRPAVNSGGASGVAEPTYQSMAMSARPREENAGVLLREGNDATVDEIIEWANARLPGYQKISGVDFLKSLPRNPAGKVLKRELRAPFWKGLGREI